MSERKNEKRIKYIVSYDCNENIDENRVNVLASSNKIDYIVRKINEAGYAVDMISTSQTLNKKFYRGKKIQRGENVLQLFPTTPRGGVVLRAFNALVMRIAIAFYFFKNVKCNETLLIYHSAGNMWMVRFLKRLKHANVIEEVEEIYGDIYGKRAMAKKERKLLQNADAYIYPTILLNREVNQSGKPYVVVHGTYDLKEPKGIEKFHEKDKCYHIAYTGIFDPKKGCLDFVKSAEYLDGTFYLHVLGFGSKEEIDKLNDTIEEVISRTECNVSYDGIRRGVEYEEYLQKLDAGICPLDSDDSFTKTQFPSKVISYLANGLKVICSNVDAVRTSDVGDKIVYYEGNGPESIARAIKELRGMVREQDSRETIKACDVKFGAEIARLLREMEENGL